MAVDAIDAKRNNRYSVTSFLTTPHRFKIKYDYVRWVLLRWGVSLLFISILRSVLYV